jgi:redox-sensitive bicupin YhaK (pirin superfamily)
LSHRDSMGNSSVIHAGEIQVMSAGTGIEHSEFNSSKDTTLNLLQIWVFPNQQNVTPRYDQQVLSETDRHNKFHQILSPNKEDEGVWIYQNAWFHLGKFDRNFETTYQLKWKGNGVYAFVINGDISINGQILNARDGLGIWDFDTLKIKANSQDTEILLMEIPMG